MRSKYPKNHVLLEAMKEFRFKPSHVCVCLSFA